MDDELLMQSLNIRYVKLEFVLRIQEDTKLPVSKVSAIRGGLGEMLLEQNCVRDRQCDNCDFESECIVRRTMYSKYKIQPAFATGKDSIGYILECENYEEDFPAGSALIFYLILFGRTIVYLNQYLMAVAALGQHGLGKYQARFTVDQVINEWKQPLVDGMNVYKSNYRITTLADYVRFRTKELNGSSYTVLLKSPATIKFRGEEMRELYPLPILESAARKVYMLDCYEGLEIPQADISEEGLPLMTEHDETRVQTRRYSSTADTKMVFTGIKGSMRLENVSFKYLALLVSAEITHVGKNTSFGFGRVKVKEL
jgi:hypothetical protein